MLDQDMEEITLCAKLLARFGAIPELLLQLLLRELVATAKLSRPICIDLAFYTCHNVCTAMGQRWLATIPIHL